MLRFMLRPRVLEGAAEERQECSGVRAVRTVDSNAVETWTSLDPACHGLAKA